MQHNAEITNFLMAFLCLFAKWLAEFLIEKEHFSEQKRVNAVFIKKIIKPKYIGGRGENTCKKTTTTNELLWESGKTSLAFLFSKCCRL